MDRRKAEIRLKQKALIKECETASELLRMLVQESSNYVQEVEELDGKDFRQYMNYYLAVMHFQNSSTELLTKMNIELEGFLTEDTPPNLEHFKLINSANRRLSSNWESDCNSFSPSLPLSHEPFARPETPSKKVETAMSKFDSDSQISYASDIGDKAKQSFVPYKIRTTEEIASNKITAYITNHAKIKNVKEKPIVDDKEFLTPNEDPINSERTICVDVSSESEKSTCSTSSNVVEKPVNNEEENKARIKKYPSSSTLFTDGNGDHETIINTLNDSLTSSEHFCSVSSLNDEKEVPQIAEISQNIPSEKSREIEEEPKQPTRSQLSHKLNTLPLMTLEEKFIKSLCRRPTPDYTLRPSSKFPVKYNAENKNVKSFNSDLVTDTEDATNKDNDVTLKNIENSSTSRTTEKSKATKEVEYRDVEDSCIIKEIKYHEAPKVGDICMLGNVVSPSEFYVQVADENSTLVDSLSLELADLYKNTLHYFTTKLDAMNRLGNFCSLSMNNYWYRIEVLDWMLDAVGGNKLKILVQLIDYGTKEKVNYNNLQPLPPHLCALPRMAQLCHLSYLYPPGSTKELRLKEWREQDLEGLFDILGDLDYSTFVIKHVFYCKERKSYEVELINIDEENEENTIGQILIEAGFAVQITDNDEEVIKNVMMNQIRTAHGIQGITSDMLEEEILEKFFEQNSFEEARTLNEAVMHYNPRDEAETCRNLREDGTCYKGSRCKLRHIPLRNGYTRDKTGIYKRPLVEDDPVPKRNEVLLMTISHIVSINCFYVQVKKQNGFPGKTLHTLIKLMNSSEMVNKYEKLKYPPCPGQLVIAKHWNNFWYRAQVRDVSENRNETVQVYIVDFGDTLEVPMSDLRVIQQELLQIAFQASECRLHNVKHKDGIDPADEKKHFEDRHLGQTYKAKVIAVPGYLEVLLENNRGEDVGLQLIADGFGEFNNEHITPAEDELILID